MDKVECAGCRHWHTPERERRDGRPASGECRRHAPRPQAGTASVSVTWPRTRASDWCGEFASVGAGDQPVAHSPSEKATLVEREPVRRGRQGQLACRGLVCITDRGSKLVIWGRDSNMHNLHAVSRARLPVRVSFVPTTPERWSQERYGDTHWVEPEDLLAVHE